MTESIIHLIHRAGQAADAIFGQHTGATGLTPRQAVVLAAIAADDAPSQTALVAATGIDRSTMADIVRRLTHLGLVARKRTRADARRYAVRLTPAGYRALDDARDAEIAAEDALLAELPEAQRASLRRGLKRLARDAGRIDPAPTLVAAE